MPKPVRRENRTPPPGHRPVKITLGEMRATGVRDLLVFCEDYRCSHNLKLEPAYVDRWPDDVRLSDLEPKFICKACGRRGAILRGGSEPTMMCCTTRASTARQTEKGRSERMPIRPG
ncbi:hypothetical protein Q2941_45820 [Bradyrhizobium sp. UFLA05-153]